MMHTLIKYIFMLLLLFVAVNKANAGCEYVDGYTVNTGYINFGDVNIQRDLPVASVIKKIVFTGLSNLPGDLINCDDAKRKMKYGDTTYQTIVKDGITYFESGIEGVGIKVTSNSGYWQNVWNNGALPILLEGGECQWSGHTISYCGGSWGTGGLTFELVKISDHTGSGVIQAGGNILKASINNEIDAYNFALTASKINTLKCTITTPGLNFAMGDIAADKFSDIIGFLPGNNDVNQNMVLDCDADANINVSLTGTQNPDIDDATVLALTGQGNADVAKGVGVQIVYNGTPLELNKNIVLKKSAGGQETFPLTARYYQTKTKVQAGSANASATLNLTYQ